MKRWFFVLLVMAGLVFGVGFSSSGPAVAKMKFKKALGLKSCNDCHDKGKPKKEASDNALYKDAKKMVTKYASSGKSCNDCHQGQKKPPKTD